MFFKEVRDRNKTPGKVYVYYMLVRSFRDERGISRDRVLLNVGKLPYSREELQWLARRIDEILSGQTPLQNAASPELEAEAHELAARVLERQLKGPIHDESTGPGLISFEPQQLQSEDARSVAGEQLLVASARQLGLEQAFRQAGLGQKQSRLATALVTARALKGALLQDLVPWLAENSAVDELLGVSLSSLTTEEAQRLARRMARRRNFICPALADGELITDGNAKLLLDLRRCSAGWLFGFVLTPTGLPRFPAIFRLHGRRRTEPPAAVLQLAVPPDGWRSALLILQGGSGCSIPFRYEKGFRYLLLQQPPETVLNALQESTSPPWQSRDGEWVLPAKPGKQTVSSVPRLDPSDHVLLRTNLADPEELDLRGTLSTLLEIDRDLSAVQPVLDGDHPLPSRTAEPELFLSFLALWLVRAFRLRLRSRDYAGLPWPALRELFASQTRLTLRVPDPFGNHMRYIRTTTRPGEKLARLYDALDMPWDLLGNRYFAV